MQAKALQVVDEIVARRNGGERIVHPRPALLTRFVIPVQHVGRKVAGSKRNLEESAKRSRRIDFELNRQPFVERESIAYSHEEDNLLHTRLCPLQVRHILFWSTIASPLFPPVFESTARILVGAPSPTPPAWSIRSDTRSLQWIRALSHVITNLDLARRWGEMYKEGPLRIDTTYAILRSRLEIKGLENSSTSGLRARSGELERKQQPLRMPSPKQEPDACRTSMLQKGQRKQIGSP